MNSSISFGPGDYKSDIFAIATGTIQALASTGDIAFGGDIDFETFYGPNTASIILGADGDYSLTVAGDVHFWAQAADVQSITQIYAANSGTVDISGGVQIECQPFEQRHGRKRKPFGRRWPPQDHRQRLHECRRLLFCRRDDG